MDHGYQLPEKYSHSAWILKLNPTSFLFCRTTLVKKEKYKNRWKDRNSLKNDIKIEHSMHKRRYLKLSLNLLHLKLLI